MDFIGSHRRCCVVNCPNDEKNCADRPYIKFYPFPGKYYEVERKKQWVIAVNRRNSDGTLWQPTVFSRICSEHFYGGRISEDEDEPGFIPTIFPRHEKLPDIAETSLKTTTPVTIEKVVKITPVPTSTKRNLKISPKISLIEKTFLNSKSTQVRFQFDLSKFVFSSVAEDTKTKKNKIIECNIGYNPLDFLQSETVSKASEEISDCAVDSDDCIDCDDDNHCNHKHNFLKPQPKCKVKTEDKCCGPDGLLFSEVLMDVCNKRRKLS